MLKKREADIPVTASSGNVFADMGLPEAEEELTKAQLAKSYRAGHQTPAPDAGCGGGDDRH